MGNTARILEHREVTYEDLCNLPEHLTGEIINGELYTQPRPTPAHARASSALGAKFVPPFDFGENGPGGWIILDEPELHLGSKPHIIVPDIAGWRRERMPSLPTTAWFETAPDWVCEVISPSTAGKDRVKKMPIYAEFGVQHLWLVDPLERTLEAYRLHDGQWLRIGAWADDEAARIEPFDAVELNLKSLWSV
ncbi:MAG: Uma2 family endonuclease [Thiothrix litoralis]|jgi:Uma2 family endonuclease|uniref:Uma2 family endonuclease n=1 Tax=Thiothrix litoralis TaxID=2891210 RepID=UPI003C7563C2